MNSLSLVKFGCVRGGRGGAYLPAVAALLNERKCISQQTIPDIEPVSV